LNLERFSFHFSVEGGSGEWKVSVSGVLVGKRLKKGDLLGWGNYIILKLGIVSSS
jgi:hypothetical protein